MNARALELTEELRSKFYTKGGRLRPYALGCGYVESFNWMNEYGYGYATTFGWRLQLLANGGGSYDVKCFDYGTHRHVFYKSYSRLTDARRAYDKVKRIIKKYGRKTKKAENQEELSEFLSNECQLATQKIGDDW